MRTSDTYALLRSVRQQLAGYEVVQCGLAHERVVTATQDDHGISPDHPGWHFKLKGFCARDSRAQRLGCAHTMVNDRYKKIVNTLIEADVASNFAAPLAEIDAIVQAIYRSDHDKGRLEKLCGVLRVQDDPHALREVERRLEHLLAEHFKLIERLQLLHRDILGRIDCRMADLQVAMRDQGLGSAAMALEYVTPEPGTDS
jgi:hypothetical protein